MLRWLNVQAPFSVQLGAKPEPAISLTIGDDKDPGAGLGKARFTLAYAYSLKVEQSYIVDESCVRIMAEGLNAALKAQAG